ncbi:MAG TPA: BatA domain-containing protein [Verrucomicrobiae bacterium]
MNFLTPLFLFGALAVAGPIIFHLVRRTTNDRFTFSSLLFLQPTPPKLTRRSRVEHWLLLLMRCLVLGLLALGFARPFFNDATRAGAGGNLARQRVILLDVSASMQRDGVWIQAKQKVEKLLADAKPTDQFAFYTFDQQAKAMVSFEQWRLAQDSERKAVAVQRLNDTKPGWRTTHLGNALATAAEALEEEATRSELKTSSIQREIIVVTDLQEGAKLDGLQGMQWPEGVKVEFEKLDLGKRSNAGVQIVAEGEEAATQSAGEQVVRVRVSNATDSRKEQFQVGWAATDGRQIAGVPVNVHVPAGQSRVVAVQRSVENMQSEKIVLTGDDDLFDNTVHAVKQEADRATVLFIGEDQPADTKQLLFYVQRGLQTTRSLALDVANRTTANFPTAAELGAARLIIVGQALTAGQNAELRRMAENGKTVIVVLKDKGMAPSVADLLKVSNLPVEEHVSSRHMLLGQVDFTHPLFAPFADPRFSDFTRIYFWKYREVNLDGVKGAKVLARFDDEKPALFSVNADKGQIFVFTSGWHPADSQLALSSKFVPLLYSFLEQGGAMTSRRAQFAVGDEIPVPLDATAKAQVTRPDGEKQDVSGRKTLSAAELPGIYDVQDNGKHWRFAVNLPAEESRTAPLPVEELERLGIPVHSSSLATAQQTQARTEKLKHAELENRQKLWRWLVVAALAVLLVETWLAARLTRPAQTTAPA